jgi:hypothetical protein
MKQKLFTLLIASALAAGAAFAQSEKKAGEATAAQAAAGAGMTVAGHARADAPQPGELHGGKLIATPGGNFETVFAADGVRIYFYTAGKTPAMVEGQTGSVVLMIAGGARQEIPLVAEAPAEKEPGVYFCPMHTEVVQMTPGVCNLCGGMRLYEQNRLFGKADLSKAEAGSVTAEIRIRGLQGKMKEVRFSATNAQAEPAATGKAKS